MGKAIKRVISFVAAALLSGAALAQPYWNTPGAASVANAITTPCTTANAVLYNASTPCSANLTWAAATGQGLAMVAGTATTDVAALSVTRTNNNAAVATGVKIAFTDTTSAAGFLPFEVLGGASATTSLFKVDKSGNTTAPGTVTAGGATPFTSTTSDTGTHVASLSNSNTAGIVQFNGTNNSSKVINVGILGSGTGSVGSVINGSAFIKSDAVGFAIGTAAAIPLQFITGTGQLEQVRILDTASATRYLTLTGSNGGNPTIDVSAGSLAITPSTVFATTIFTTALTAASGTPSSICQNAATKEVTVNAALTCTVSSAEYKSGIESFGGNALKVVNAMEPSSFFYKDRLDRPRLGFIAESLAAIDPRLAEWDHGRPNSIDFPAIMAVQTKALQELDARLRKVEAK